ncbi:MAG: DNA polymerase III subunit gamma/tau [bacterium]|nr:DNA polymerase III subunit gamma/tau [bacterium]
MALYRKYRSKKLSEIVGQEHITRTLENALNNGNISHAYLFTGPRGTGKTSIARILAHEINQLPYTDESMHLDIIEIDAASNRRIDEIRDLREKVHVTPSLAKFKVYIIDEVHMLTREAFNALLKTLEEPPAHVVFILATTELHKLPETIISRTQRFTFKPINEDKITAHLKFIAKSENIKIDDDALKLVALHGKGSFRDSISMLDQISSHKDNITLSVAQRLVGVAESGHIEQLEKAIISQTPKNIVLSIESLISDGIGASQIAKQLAALIRSRIISGEVNQAYTSLLADLIRVQTASEPAAQLEIALFQAHLLINPGSNHITQPESLPEKIVHNNTTTHEPPEQTLPKLPKKIKSDMTQESPTIDTEINDSNLSTADFWPKVLEQIKSKNNTLYGVLRMAEPSLNGDTLLLKFGFSFHQKKASDAATASKISQAVKIVTGNAYKIEAKYEASLDKKIKDTTTPAKPPAHSVKSNENLELASVKNIFGGGEVLES